MPAIAATLINWDALWKIVVVALIGGTGVVVAFGLTLLGLERARTARSRATRLAHRALAGVCCTVCVAAVATGLYAIAGSRHPKATPKVNLHTAPVRHYANT